jgi:signal transduction histidine kinase
MDAASLARRFFSRRAVLWAGFGGLLLLMLTVAFTAEFALRHIESSSTDLRRQFLRRNRLLHAVRLQLYQSGIDLRDLLLEPRSAAAEARRRDLQNSRLRMFDAVAQLRVQSPAREAATVAELARDIDLYWNRLQPVLAWDAALRGTRGERFLREEVIPLHEQLLDLADRAAELNDRQLQAGERNTGQVFADFRSRLIASELLTIAVGMVLASLTVRRILSLERTSEIRYEQVVLGRADLQHLSARLVAAQEDERRRLSRELHDEVGQSMSAVIYELGNLQVKLPPAAAHLSEHLARARELAETSVGAVRNMALLLRPSMLDDLGLVPALKWQAREVSRRTGMKVKVAADNVPDELPDEYRTCVYRIVQESLHNVTRHAHAHAVRVAVRREADWLEVLVEDDGVGFNPRQEKGMGLMGMEERVRGLGGVFRVEAAPGHGATISVRLPLAESGAAGAAR